VQCDGSLPREAAAVMGAVPLYEPCALPGLVDLAAPASPFTQVALAGVSPYAFIVLCRYTTWIPQVLFSVNSSS